MVKINTRLGVNEVKALSLFSGIGGMDLAAEWSGIKPIAFCEQNEFCQKVLNKHWSHTPIYDDVTTLSKEVLENDGINTDSIGIMFGGYPCQPFSLAGKGEEEQDERYLWGEYHRLVNEIRPKWVVGENVYGHVSRGLSRVLDDMETSGYQTWVFVSTVSSIGGPHERKRVFWIACNTDSESKLQENKKISTFRSEWQTWQSSSWKSWRTLSAFDRGVPKPSICRMDDGFSRELDKSRLIALGNAVVPQQIYPIFKAIMDIESGE